MNEFFKTGGAILLLVEFSSIPNIFRRQCEVLQEVNCTGFSLKRRTQLSIPHKFFLKLSKKLTAKENFRDCWSSLYNKSVADQQQK